MRSQFENEISKAPISHIYASSRMRHVRLLSLSQKNSQSAHHVAWALVARVSHFTRICLLAYETCASSLSDSRNSQSAHDVAWGLVSTHLSLCLLTCLLRHAQIEKTLVTCLQDTCQDKSLVYKTLVTRQERLHLSPTSTNIYVWNESSHLCTRHL